MRLKTFWVWIFLLCLIGVPDGAFAEQVSFTERSDDEYLILGLEVNGTERSEGIDAFLPTNYQSEELLIPLSSLINALSYAIEVNPGDGMAEGWFEQQSNVFQLDLQNEEVIIGSREISLQPGQAEAHVNDIFVKATALEEWFNLSIELDFSNLLLVITSNTDLPFEEAKARKQRAKLASKRTGGFSIDPEKAYFLPYKTFSTPSLLFQNTTTYSKTKTEQRIENIQTLQANMDFLKFNTDLDLAYKLSSRDDNEILTSRLTLRRQDPKRNILGPLNAGKIELGDVYFPSVPLFTGSQLGAGILVSSDPELGFRTTNQLNDFIFEEEAPVGWDAELFRNGQFLDFQTVGTDGRFVFEDLELINGYNLFKVVLYGPEGQQEVITREIFRGPNMLEKGELTYQVAAGAPQADFLPLSDTSRENYDASVAAETFYGVTKNLTVGLSVYEGPSGEDQERSRSAAFSAAAAFLGINAQTTALYADGGRTGYQATLRARPLGFNTAVSYTRFNNFDPDDQDIKNETEVSIGKNFKFINVSFIGRKTDFLDQDSETEIQNIVSTDIVGIKVTNDLSRVFSDNPSVDDFVGSLSMLTSLFDFRLRGILNYDLDSDADQTLTNFRVSAIRSFENNTSLRLNTDYDFASDIYRMDARYSREFGDVTVDFNVGGSTDDDYSAGITLRTGLQPSANKGYEFVDPRRSALASLGVRAFIDENGNEMMDVGEEPLENVIFTSSKGGAKGQTGSDGIAWLYGLFESPTRINVSAEEIPSIYTIPSRENFDLIPRRGSNAIVDYPFTLLGEVDGFVYLEGTEEPVSNVPVIIVNAETGKEVASMNSEFDGYYVFSALPLGDYRVMTSYGWFEENSPETSVANITLNADNSVLLDVNLFLPPEDIELSEQADPFEGQSN